MYKEDVEEETCDPLTLIGESNTMKCTTEAHHLMQESIKEKEESLDPYDDEIFNSINCMNATLVKCRTYLIYHWKI